MASRRWLRGQSDVTVSLSAPRPLTTLGASRSTGPFDEVRRVYGDFATALGWAVWGVAGAGGGTTRRRRVGRPTATLIFAGRNRTAGMRSRVPLTRCAPATPAHSAHGDRCCFGGAATRRGLRGGAGRADRRSVRGFGAHRR